MQLKDTIGESQAFLTRAIVAGMLVLLAVLVVLWRMVQLQVVDHEHFTTLSRDNRVKVVPLPPTRGLIYDRQGVLLAQNRPAYSLEITPEQVDDLDRTLAELAQVIEISAEDLDRFQQLKKRKRRFDSVPIRINLSPDETAQFAVHRHRFPGDDIKAQLLRHCPPAPKTTHVPGYGTSSRSTCRTTPAPATSARTASRRPTNPRCTGPSASSRSRSMPPDAACARCRRPPRNPVSTSTCTWISGCRRWR